MKAFVAKNGTAAAADEQFEDDALFLKEYPPGGKVAPPKKNKGKELTVFAAVVEAKPNDTTLILRGTSPKAPAIKIKLTLPDELKNQIANVDVGSRLQVKGECTGLGKEDGMTVVYINRAWIGP